MKWVSAVSFLTRLMVVGEKPERPPAPTGLSCHLSFRVSRQGKGASQSVRCPICSLPHPIQGPGSHRAREPSPVTDKDSWK